MNRTDFENLVADAIDSLPDALLGLMENVEVVVEDEPPEHALNGVARDEGLYGLYEGIPLTERFEYSGVMPDKISIYRGPLERDFADPDDIWEEVQITVVHEIAHHFGISDARLAELGWS